MTLSLTWLSRLRTVGTNRTPKPRAADQPSANCCHQLHKAFDHLIYNGGHFINFSADTVLAGAIRGGLIVGEVIVFWEFALHDIRWQ